MVVAHFLFDLLNAMPCIGRIECAKILQPYTAFHVININCEGHFERSQQI